MGMKEKLVELVHNARMNALWHNAPNPSEYITDMLMEDGVTVQEWIPVSEKLPKDGNKVIVYSYENGDFHTAELDGKLWHLDCGWLLDVDDFTHWMPLPQPPKGE